MKNEKKKFRSSSFVIFVRHSERSEATRTLPLPILCGLMRTSASPREISLVTRHCRLWRLEVIGKRPARAAGTFMGVIFGFDDEGVVVTQRTRRSASLPSVTATSGCLLLSLSASPLLSWAASPPYEVIGKPRRGEGTQTGASVAQPPESSKGTLALKGRRKATRHGEWR